jgi:D-sedoheptulose 7-phosphate isomerase
MMPNYQQQADNHLAANIQASQQLTAQLAAFAKPLAAAVEATSNALLAGNKILCCGNGGSAADGAHLAAEIAGRYLLARPGYPAIDLTANSSLLTALVNDYPPHEVFARQIDAFGSPGDVIIAFTTSGNSENIRLALLAANNKKITTIAFLGRDGGRCRGLAQIEFIIPSDHTARIQEAHQLLFHSLCDCLDPILAKKTNQK